MSLSSNVANFRIRLMKWKSGFECFINETSMDCVTPTTESRGWVGFYLGAIGQSSRLEGERIDTISLESPTL